MTKRAAYKKIACAVCGEFFYMPNRNYEKTGTGKYCSRKCQHISQIGVKKRAHKDAETDLSNLVATYGKEAVIQAAERLGK